MRMELPMKRPPLFVADDKFPDVIAQLQKRGWTRFAHESFPKFALKWSNYAKIAWPRVGREQIVNHFHNAVVLSRKDALAQRLYASGGDVDAFYPRTLDLQTPTAREKLAAWVLYGKAVGILLLTMETHCKTVTGASTAVEFIKKVLAVDDFFTLWAQELDLSALDVYSDRWRVLRGREEDSDRETCELTEITGIIEQLQALDAQMHCIQAGRGDVWICKPSNLSQGRGIHLLSDWDALMQIGDPEARDDGQEEKRVAWVAQKYVERPLLLQSGKHKFDVRQWVLITALEPLTIYWHTDSYLRFCSQPFTLDDAALGDSFTHLSNYSIQKNAPSMAEGDQAEGSSAADSMWHSRQFAAYLRETHGRDVWTETIVPQMQHATRRAIEVALPEMSQVGRGFEWLGIDFLIDATLRVWLLEVNVSPDVSRSTPVTAELVPEATRGVLDLVLGPATTGGDTDTSSGWVKMAPTAS